MSTGIPLLNLTPLYLQNTDSILNTLIFMNLDQGHDFHDGSARTRSSSGLTTWVDLDFKGKGFLNQIPRNIFNTKYPDKLSGIYELNSDNGDIFGKNDFIKGSLNTTFIGGNGAYAFVVIDDSNLKKIPLETTPEELILNKINKEINIKIENTGEKYCIFAEGDTKGENGRTFNIGSEDNDINILFLPFYQRVYNGSMHKLWTFNTIKHIYLIKLTTLNLTKTPSLLEITEKVFTCNKLTEISNIVPQYVLNFNNFISGIKKGDKKRFNKIILQKINDNNLSEISKPFIDSKNDIKISQISNANFPEELKKIILDQFLCDLLTNNLNQSNIENTSTNELKYEDGKFRLGMSSNDFLELIPRGTKYYFENCGDKNFRYFLDLLYAYQKPFIHPNYDCGKTDIVNYAKNKILENIQDDVLKEYNDFKISKTKVEESTDSPFISKQYGFITDTNIGSASTESTAEFIIDSLNDTINQTSQTAGAGELDKLVAAGIQASALNPIYKGNSYAMAKDSIKRILDTINKKENKEELIEVLKQFVLVKYKQDISSLIKPTSDDSMDVVEYDKQSLKRKSEDDTSEDMLFKKQMLSPVTDKESISPGTDSMDETSKDTDSMDVVGNELVFDNIENVNNIFDLSLNSKDLSESPFVNINSKSTRQPIDDYVNKYANNLQLYYDYESQKGDSDPNNNYFNNCWQSTDFYQKGGVDYPFKFTIASGSMDSSSLGGQSIPQYHPPEVDIYMPIFNLDGPNSNLKGIIVRMVVVKEILNNQINSKSKVVVFCHFVYVDFERTHIVPPTVDAYGNDLISEYPEQIKKLLQFTIENTVYIKEKTECVNLDTLSKEDLNKNVDFKLINLYDADGKQTLSRNWYKYYTHTQGPTVKESIVIPVNYNTLEEIQFKTNSDYVASGIVDVATNIISSSEKLRNIFKNNQTLFIKLFLVRNKYTGDKSRSTDSLFLNQSKYLEGVQISNDENTLYNAQMFGLNTVWSTSAKSVFYMAPYMTKEEKVPITTGSYIKELNDGLKNNPNIKVYSSQKDSIDKKPGDDMALIRSDIFDEIMENIDQDFVNKANKTIKTGSNIGVEMFKSPRGFMQTFIDLIYENREKLNPDINEFLEFCDFLNVSIQKCLLNFDDNCEELINFKMNEFTKKYDYIIDTIKDIKETYLPNAYKYLIQIKSQLMKIDPKSRETVYIESFDDEDIDKLFSLILYLSKASPWWLEEILNYKEKLIKYNYCKTFKNVFDTLKKAKDEGKLDNTRWASKISKEKFQEKFQKKFQEMLNSPSFNPEVCKTPITELPTEPTDYLKEYIPKTPDDDNYVASDELKNIENNDLRYKIATGRFLQKIKNGTIPDPGVKNPIGNQNDPSILAIPENELAIQGSKYIVKRKPAVTQRATDIIGGKINVSQNINVNESPNLFKEKESVTQPEEQPELINTITEKKNTITDIDVVKETQSTDFSTNLDKFYENTYKCNIGNRIKNYIEVITNIQSEYVTSLDDNDSININDNSNTLVINILIKNIDFINKSFSPKVNFETIKYNFSKVDETYSVQQMNSILNIYSSQLEIISLIEQISSNNLTQLEIADLFVKSISDRTLKELNIIYNKYDIVKKILQQENNIMQNELENVDNDTNIVEMEEQSDKNQKITSGGDTKKKRNNKKMSKTINNKKVINKNKTIKKRNKKQKKQSRKH
jgi:hypothetical protein